MRLFYIFVIGILLSACTSVQKAESIKPELASRDCVILLHGMGRTKTSMLSLEEYLSTSFQVVNQGYPTRTETIEEITRVYIPKAISVCSETTVGKIHFVTHSLGGILVRQYLQTKSLPTGSRVVMLSPPNHGSEVSDHYKDKSWFQWFAGPAGQQLTTDKNSLPNRLKPVDIEVGVIAGSKTLDPWFSDDIPGVDDGKVSVESTRLNEMRDFLIVPHTHVFIMDASEVHRQVMKFLKYGKFDHDGTEKKNGSPRSSSLSRCLVTAA